MVRCLASVVADVEIWQACALDQNGLRGLKT